MNSLHVSLPRCKDPFCNCCLWTICSIARSASKYRLSVHIGNMSWPPNNFCFGFINAFVLNPANVCHKKISSVSVFGKKKKSDLFFRSGTMATVYKIVWCCPCLPHSAFLLTHFPSHACHKFSQQSASLLFDISFFVRDYFQQGKLFTRWERGSMRAAGCLAVHHWVIVMEQVDFTQHLEALLEGNTLFQTPLFFIFFSLFGGFFSHCELLYYHWATTRHLKKHFGK